MPNGTTTSQDMMVKHHSMLAEELDDGAWCLLCQRAKNNARHVLFCRAEDMGDLQEEYLQAIEDFFAEAVAAGHLPAEADELPGRVWRGDRAVGTRTHMPFVSRLGLWGPLMVERTGLLVGDLGDPVTMKTEREDDLGWRGVLPSSLRDRVKEIWRDSGTGAAAAAAKPRSVQIDAFLVELSYKIAAATRPLWAGHKALLDEALAARGIVDWRRRKGSGQDVAEAAPAVPVPCTLALPARCARQHLLLSQRSARGSTSVSSWIQRVSASLSRRKGLGVVRVQPM